MENVELEFSDEKVRASGQWWVPALVLTSHAEDERHKFEGQSIPTVVRVLSENYVKNGKWSHSRYRLLLAKGWDAWVCYDGYARRVAGGPPETRHFGAPRWSDIPPEQHGFMRKCFTKSSQARDENEKV